MRKRRSRRNSLAHLAAIFISVTAAEIARIGLSGRPNGAAPGDGEILLSSGKGAEVEINEDYASVKYCYLYDQAEQKEICSYVNQAWKEMGLSHHRSVESLVSELSLHKRCYLLGIEKEKAKDAELERKEDKRWYVRATSAALEVLGL